MIAMFVASGMVPARLTIVLLALIGFGSGIAGPSRDLLVRAACPCNATGRVYGMVYSGLDIGLSIAPLLFTVTFPPWPAGPPAPPTETEIFLDSEPLRPKVPAKLMPPFPETNPRE